MGMEAWPQGISHGPPSVCQPSPFKQRRSCIAEQSVQRQVMADTSNAGQIIQEAKKLFRQDQKMMKKKMTMKMKKMMMRSPSSPPR